MKMVVGRTYYYNGSKSNVTLASRGDKHKDGWSQRSRVLYIV